ncbi:MAG: N-acetylmuramoyl-L-alanine amidase [Flammeovirgaceae bacterium]|nr:N-acetylmuramoyl-L-alanine amidase [Flammeovirgaceae bacterium]
MEQPPLDLSKIILDRLDKKSGYFSEIFPKKQIILHHSASNINPFELIDSWRKNSLKAAASLVIAGKPSVVGANYNDGDIISVFSSRYWALHLNCHSKKNNIPASFKNRNHTRSLEKASIAIMMCNAGPLTFSNGKFYTRHKTLVPDNEVIEYIEKYRGSNFYHKYSDAQIESLRQLLDFLCNLYDIPRMYQPDMWGISPSALGGQPGIYTHTSFRTDLSDCHPQPSLIEMLVELGKGNNTKEEVSKSDVPATKEKTKKVELESPESKSD